MQNINTTSCLGGNTTEVFSGCTSLCRPNPSEQAQITSIPGSHWISDVAYGSDCCVPTLPILPNVVTYCLCIGTDCD